MNESSEGNGSLEVELREEYTHLFCLLNGEEGVKGRVGKYKNGRLCWKELLEKKSDNLEYLMLSNTRLWKLNVGRGIAASFLISTYSGALNRVLKSSIQSTKNNSPAKLKLSQDKVSSEGSCSSFYNSSSSAVFLKDSGCKNRYNNKGHLSLNRSFSSSWSLPTAIFWVTLKVLGFNRFREMIVGCERASKPLSISWLSFSSLSKMGSVGGTSSTCGSSQNWYIRAKEIKRRSHSGVNDTWSGTGISGVKITLSGSSTLVTTFYSTTRVKGIWWEGL